MTNINYGQCGVITKIRGSKKIIQKKCKGNGVDRINFRGKVTVVCKKHKKMGN